MLHRQDLFSQQELLAAPSWRGSMRQQPQLRLLRILLPCTSESDKACLTALIIDQDGYLSSRLPRLIQLAIIQLELTVLQQVTSDNWLQKGESSVSYSFVLPQFTNYTNCLEFLASSVIAVFGLSTVYYHAKRLLSGWLYASPLRTMVTE